MYKYIYIYTYVHTRLGPGEGSRARSWPWLPWSIKLFGHGNSLYNYSDMGIPTP